MPAILRRPAALALAAAAATGACVALIGAPSAPAADDPATPAPPTLHVVGVGSAFRTPDRVAIGIRVGSGAFDATRARSRANAEINAVVAAVVALGVERADVRTLAVTLQRSSRPPLPGHHQRRAFYLASSTIDVTTGHVALAGKVIDAATGHGADGIDGPSFSFSDPTAGRPDAEQAALHNARARADAAAAATGMRVTGAKSIDLDPGTSYYESDAGAAASAPAPSPKALSVPTHVTAGREEVDATVDVVYTLAPA